MLLPVESHPQPVQSCTKREYKTTYMNSVHLTHMESDRCQIIDYCGLSDSIRVIIYNQHKKAEHFACILHKKRGHIIRKKKLK